MLIKGFCVWFVLLDLIITASDFLSEPHSACWLLTPEPPGYQTPCLYLTHKLWIRFSYFPLAKSDDFLPSSHKEISPVDIIGTVVINSNTLFLVGGHFDERYFYYRGLEN